MSARLLLEPADVFLTPAPRMVQLTTP